jgi:hypothetical protein
MRTASRKGLWLALIHVAIVASLGGKLLLDRVTRPRVWARAAPVDPNLPIRGRYVRLRLEADLEERRVEDATGKFALIVRADRLVAVRTDDVNGVSMREENRGGQQVAVLQQPLAYFIPDRVADPSRRPEGEELWVEVTLPRRGAPRPIRLGVKRDGVLTPLDVR